MRNSVTSLVIVLAVVAGSAVLLARQQGQPGMAPARFWINNRAADEAIPVNLHGSAAVDFTERAVGTLNQIHGKTQVTSRTRQPWEYREVSPETNQEIAGILNQLGNDGWEAVGITTSANNGRRTVLLKRPR